MLQETRQKLLGMNDMAFQGRGINQYVISVCYLEFAQLVPQHIINQTLKHQRSVRETVRHDAVLELARGGAKGCLLLVTIFDVCKIVGTESLVNILADLSYSRAEGTSKSG